MSDPNYPDAPPRPASFSAGPHRTPGLPQATPDRPAPGPQAGAARHQDGGGYYDTPAAAIVASAKRVVETFDSLGRRLRIRFLSPRDRMMLAKAIGADLAKNEVYLGYATLAWAVVELDNGSGEDPRIMPMVKASEVEFLVDRLGDEGLTAVGNAYRDHFAEQLQGVDVDLAKN